MSEAANKFDMMMAQEEEDNKDIIDGPDFEEADELPEVACFDDASANYLLRRIREATEQYDKMEAWYAEQLRKLAAIRDRTIAWAEHGLRSYLEMVPAKKSKTQISYELPNGKLVLKAQAPEYVRDDEALVPWLKKNKMDSFIKVKESANWAELKKTLKESPDGTAVMTEDGEIVPGVKVEQREMKFQAIPNMKER